MTSFQHESSSPNTTETDANMPLREEIFSVTDLNRMAKSLLESHFQFVWLKGELSNLAKPRSGHLYFTLKDEHAQVRCAMFKHQQRGIDFDVTEGTEVLIQGTVSLYAERGDFQLIANKMLLWGTGQLQQAFDKLKQKLQNLGWFDEQIKKPLPLYPNTLGIVTSSTGDALQDILKILRHRYPVVRVIVYPTLVQGKNAAPSIVKAIQQAVKHKQADILLLARGGGSLEDLWGFNEECVAKALYKCPIPVVTGIGHEMDYTIADFVADCRAPTPTGAAQLVTPDAAILYQSFQSVQSALKKSVQNILNINAMKVDHAEKRLIHPRDRIQRHIDKLTHQKQLVLQLMQEHLRQWFSRVDHLCLRLRHQSPALSLANKQQTITEKQMRMRKALQRSIEQKEQMMHQRFSILHSLSPLNTLKRGYTITSDTQGKPITSIKQIANKEKIVTQFEDGKVISVVTKD